MAKRPGHAMPDEVAQALKSGGMTDDYAARPRYQRNDDLGWIARSVGDDTREKRTAQMLDELKRGGVYMGMKHAPSVK